MVVVDHEPQMWFLFRKQDALFLDASCRHGAIEYSVLIQLDQSEIDQYKSTGRSFLNSLAQAIHQSAPAVMGSNSPYEARNLTSVHAHEIETALEVWRGNKRVR